MQSRILAHDLSDYFHRQSFEKLALLAGVPAWCWIMYALESRLLSATQALPLIAIVLGGGWLIYRLYGSAYPMAVYLFLIAQVLFITAVLWATGDAATGYLFILAITAAGALAGPIGSYATAAAALGVVAGLSIGAGGEGARLPVSLILQIGLAAFVAHQAAKGLHSALASAEIGAAAARDHAEEARRHRAELQQAQKSLHLANYQLQRANAELFSAREVAEAAMRFKSDFAAQSSHEFRTSLNLILGFSETMAFSQHTYGARLPAAYLRDVTEIYRNSRHLLALIDDILDLSRLEAGRMGLHREPVDINSIVGEAVDILRPMVERKGIELRMEAGQGLPRLWLDRVRIRQVLSNLLSNAARVTAQGSIIVRTELRVGIAPHAKGSARTVERDAVVVSVTDTGPGIEPGEMESIFKEFHQVDRVEGQSGRVGLGLAVSKQIILLHGGNIWAESEVGRGSTFSFGFELEGGNALGAVSPLIRGEPVLPFRAPRPAVVVLGRGNSGEDSDEVKFLRRHLDEEFAILASRDHAEARRLVAESNARAVIVNAAPDEPFAQPGLTDVRVAGADALGERRSVPVIYCPVPGPTQVAKALGICDFVQKPVAMGALHAALNRLPRPQGPRARRQKLLLVDDEPAAIRLLERIVQSLDAGQANGHEVELFSAYSGRDALARISAQRPDAILLDLSMADGDGLWLIDQLRNDAATAEIPIIGVSGQAIEELWQTRSIVLASADGLSATEVLGYLRGLLKALPPGMVVREPTTHRAADFTG